MVVFSWFIFFLNPYIGLIFGLIGLYKDRKRNVHYSIMLALWFASLAYWFVPNHEMDLTRYFLYLSNYSNMSWYTFTEVVLKEQILIVQELFFFGISKTNNFHLLPAVVIFITYALTFYMITNFANRNKVSSKHMFIAILFIVCVLPFPSLVSNVRNILAFVIFIFAVYRDFEQNKKNILTYILYIIPIFIHIAALALLIIRLLTVVYDLKKKNRIIISFGIISITFIIGNFASIIENSFLSSNLIISAFFNKADSYVSNTDTTYAIYLQTNAFSQLQKIYFVGMVVFFIIILYLIKRSLNKAKKLQGEMSRNNMKMLSFYSLLCLMVIGTAPIVLTVYARFTFIAVILSFIVIFRGELLVKNKLYRQLISIGLFVGAIGGLLHQIAFMSKMTNIYEMFTNSMVRSLFNMFIS